MLSHASRLCEVKRFVLADHGLPVTGRRYLDYEMVLPMNPAQQADSPRLAAD